MDGLYEIETFRIKLAVEEPRGEPCRSAEEVFRIMTPIYETTLDADVEHFAVVFLNNKNIIRAHKVISSGSLTSSLVHPREVYRAACLYGAAAIIFVHNHPSGNPAPSPDDIELTERLKKVGDAMGIRVLDHVVLGREKYFSFSDRGLLNGSAPIPAPAFAPSRSNPTPRELEIARANAARAALGAPLIGTPTGRGGTYRLPYKRRKPKPAEEKTA